MLLAFEIQISSPPAPSTVTRVLCIPVKNASDDRLRRLS
jgi:hypothetical protein